MGTTAAFQGNSQDSRQGARIHFQFSLEGTDKAAAQLSYLENDALTVQILRAIVKKAIEPAYQQAVARIPVDAEQHQSYKGPMLPPGYAKSAVRVITAKRSDNQGVDAVLGVRKLAYYAINFVELGTSKQQAQLWLRPAMQGTADQQASICADEFKARVLAVTQVGG